MRLPQFRLDPASPFFERELGRAMRLIVDALNFGEVRVGPSADRPVGDELRPGRLYADSTLGKLIMFDGTDWVNADGSAL